MPNQAQKQTNSQRNLVFNNFNSVAQQLVVVNQPLEEVLFIQEMTLSYDKAKRILS